MTADYIADIWPGISVAPLSIASAKKSLQGEPSGERRRSVWWSLALVVLLLCGMVTAETLVTTELIQWVKQKYGEPAAVRMQEWQALMEGGRNKSEKAKLTLVNDFFNQLTYWSDLNIWGKSDYWATPLEVIGRGRADCEDYSIAKYFTLREMGVPDDKMRIMYVKALELNQAHMVLTYYPEEASVPLVLDNINGKILSADKRGDLAPVYSFNAEGLWLAKNRGRGQRVGSSSRISLWQDLKARMATEAAQ
ncbi:MAG: transglutaminase-like cysteine peptidase [Sedimenticola sp.]|nr:transglutaminase-like cysteine peptidase [Sedimenticola sp.]MCW8947596.1 transglutaminase-like cysteine peptidase [Sedimenticola sp.]MCW8974223.1 transglutaminase-like cysteine peptidase [Sedimenticola sp.]